MHKNSKIGKLCCSGVGIIYVLSFQKRIYKNLAILIGLDIFLLLQNQAEEKLLLTQSQFFAVRANKQHIYYRASQKRQIILRNISLRAF